MGTPAPVKYEILANIAGNPGFYKGQIATLNDNDARNLQASGLARIYRTPEEIAEDLLEQRRPDIERAAIVSHLAGLGLDYDGNPLPARDDGEDGEHARRRGNRK